MFKNWSMPSQKTYSNVMRLLESPYMRSMPTDTLMQNLTVTEPEAELCEGSPFPMANHTPCAGGCQTVLGAGRLYHNGLWWPPGLLSSFPMTGTPQGLCKFHHHKKATGMLHAEQLLPDIWLAFQIFHLILTSLSIKSTAIIRPSSKSVKMLHSET